MRDEIRAIVLASLFLFAASARAAGGFSDWAAIVVAGDWHSHDGSVARCSTMRGATSPPDLVRMGFSPANILQFSQRPARYPGRTLMADAQTIANSLWDLSNRTSAGCLIYFTSHGSPDGMILDDGVLEPAKLAQMVDNACGDRPTVVIVSACFSGVFVPALYGPNRMVLTAARPDRTSFGCGADDTTPSSMDVSCANCRCRTICPALPIERAPACRRRRRPKAWRRRPSRSFRSARRSRKHCRVGN